MMTPSMRVVFDTNIFISAALRGGFSEDILRIAASTDLVILICSENILEELNQKLTTKFGWAKKDAAFFVSTIRDICQVVEVKDTLKIITRDPKDNIILECAVSGNANLIVSSDQDLITLKEFRGIGIIHPKTLSWTFPEYFKKRKK
jgi:putative PIN family toxin of toxin-antitoxin system